MLLKNKYIFLFFILILSLKGYSQAACGPICSNPDFESGTGGGWIFESDHDGSNNCGACSIFCNLPHPSVCLGTAGFSSPQHTIMTLGGYDPMVGGTILPVVSPFGGTKSLKLGDGNSTMGDGTGVVAKASRATFKYLVEPTTASFTYRYAIVVEEPAVGFPPHSDAERPFFNVAVRDAAGNQISCGDLYVVARPPMTDFTQTNNRARNVWYRGWSTVVLPLAAYIGQCVSIEFTTGDCALGAHFGYAYIDAGCDPADVITSAPNACGGFQLAAPTNAQAYKWTNKADGSTTGIQGPNTNQTADVNQAGTYQVEMSSLAGIACAMTLDVTVGPPGINPVSFTPFTGCAGTYTQFTDTSTPEGGNPATGWAWDFNNDNIADAVIKNPRHVFPANGTYPVTLTIFVGNCSNSIKKDVFVDLPIYPIIDPAGPFCISASPVTLHTSIPGGTWSGTGITDSIAGVFDPSKANIGSNQIIYATAESCPGKDTITIVINGPVSDAGRDIVLCTGGTGNLGTTTTAGYSYSWSPPDGLSSTTVSNPTVTLINNQTTPIITTYTLVTTNTVSNCPATDEVVVTFNTLPIIDAGPDQTICEGATINLNGTAGGSTTSYTWSGGSGTYNPDNTTLTTVYTPNPFEVANGSVALTLTSNDPSGPCSSVNDQMVIIINPVATVNAGIDQTICIGTAANLGGSIGGSASTGTWSGGTGTFNNPNAPNPIYTPSTAEENVGTLTLTYTTDDPQGDCPAVSDQITIILSPLPKVDAGPDQTICSGSSATLAGSMTEPASNIIWSGGNGTFNPANTSTNGVYTPNGAEAVVGIVNLTITSNAVGACPPATDQMSIKINPEAKVNAGIDQTICIGSVKTGNAVALAGSLNGSATSGTWTGGAEGTYSANTNDPNAIYTLSATETANAIIAMTFTTDDPVGPCPAVSDQMMILIDQIPTVNAGPDQTICNGSTANLAAIITGSATSATWSGGNGTFSPNNTSLNCIYTPTPSEIALGNVVLTLTTNDPAGPCPSVNDQIIISINPLAIASAGSDQTICSGTKVTLAGVYNGAATSGSWSGGSGTFSPDNTVSNAIYTTGASENIGAIITLTYTTNDPTGPCPAISDQMIITVDPSPTVNAGNVQPVCFGEKATLHGSIGGSASSATWSGGTGTYSPNNTTLNAIYTPSAAEYSAGSVILTLTTDDPAGPCPPVSANVTFNFFPPPVVNFIVDDPDGCPEHCVQFTDFTSPSPGNSIVSWNWTFGDGGTGTQQSPAHCYKNTGKYDVGLWVTDNNGCKDTLKINKMITVFAVPTAEFYSTPDPASVLDQNITFINQSSTDVNFWLWSFGDGDTILPKTINPVHTYTAETSGIYHVNLTVHNKDFCYAHVEHDVKIDPAFSFFIPNAFTPRASAGINDVFNGKGVGIIKYDLWIFDRWGNEIFHSNDLDEGWDGKANEGKHVAQEDVYVWKVYLTDVFHKKHDYLGTVTLVK
jgi:gliding motility-associated-like protein